MLFAHKLKNKKLLFGLLMLVALALCLFVYFRKRVEWEPTTENLVNYEAVYHEFPVVFLRRIFDAYVANDLENVCILPFAMNKIDGKDIGFENITSGLDSFDKSYYKSKFIVWSYFENKESGHDIEILFRDKPDRIFYAWVGRNPEGEICLLGFNSSNPSNQSKNKLERLIKTLKPSIYDEGYGI